ncbi:non-neuronal cytoplasmic intermediate filament protein B-like isoform X2 [Mercenaria mercenaria]|uniref:non-neuronal cytoplasmic intermediate filament protein B-like isoform X2 n=1 Tax=Mercenaria mercenaria TaxID=6596 RepID=UPI00234F9AF1|nr:non-neuronal cytoplasmic intermediate filament protein B-like isoform X2 [Mercenaria mercenaria]
MSSEKDIRVIKKRYSVASAPIVVQNTKPGTSMSVRTSYGGPMTRRSNVMMSSSYGGGGLLPSGETAKVSKETVMSVKGSRGKEKKDLSELNGKLACYIEKSRLLEASNRALADENEKLRKLKGITGERVRVEYEEEIKELREALEELRKEFAPLKAELMSKEDLLETKDNEIEDLKKRIQDLQNQLDTSNQMICDLESEIKSLRQTCENLARDRDMAKKEVALIREDNARLRGDLEAARSLQIIAEQARDAALEELDFLETSTTHEIEELKALVEGINTLRPKIEAAWQSEFQQAVCDLQQDFDDRLATITDELRCRYEDRIAHMQATAPRDNMDGLIKTENRTLKSQLGDQKRQNSEYDAKIASLMAQIQEMKAMMERERSECENCKDELRMEIAKLQQELADVNADMAEIQDSKMSLELEIACYKKLLEGEESKMARSLESQFNMQSRGGQHLASVISGGMSSGGGGGQSSAASSMSQSTGSIKVTRSSTCGAQITELDNQGKHICISNTSSKDMDLSGWTLSRTCPKRRTKKTSEYKFESFTLPKGKTVKIYSNEYAFSMDEEKRENARLDIIALLASAESCSEWGTGDGEAALKNKDAVTKASATVTHMMG